MAATKITAYSAITQIDPAVDVGVIVDVSDTSMAASGTDKKFTANFLNFAGMAGIIGLELVYNAATVIRIRAGTIGVNGKALTFAQTDYTSASTMKDLANATVTLGNNKSYYVFAYDNSGTLNIRFEDSDGTGDGADPVFQAPYYYWTASNTGDAARRIGKFWTDGSGNIRPFVVTTFGRKRIYNINDCESLVLVNGVAQASYTSVTISPYIAGDDAEMLVGIALFATSLNTSGGIRISNDGGTGQIAVLYTSGFVSGQTGGMSDLKCVVPNTQDLKYLTINAAVGYVFLMGYSEWV